MLRIYNFSRKNQAVFARIETETFNLDGTPLFCQTACSSDTFGESFLRQCLSSLLFIKYKIKMKGNEISVKELSTDAVEWLQKLHQTLTVKE